ncbi:hypothetical protein [Comamonas sp. B21-038]|uniref:hypothetical protein n=1 Tax=Comamonas sp. B21-038 TaxID=2918299 RepID=UPI001EFBE034|nr:hypothetical protein [Comamonas sp. B21-038]ULR87212.1 hypothetical protein MJ205_12045 [Comamonas sp. B21-038]
MTAVAAFKTTATPERTVPRGVEATAVTPMGAREQLTQCRGLHLLQTHCQLFGDFICAHDVIEVDFDQRRIKGDAGYMIAFRHSDDYSWYGVRRFQSLPNCELWMADPTIHGDGQAWRMVTPELMANIEVLGMVREVYKPRSKLLRR